MPLSFLKRLPRLSTRAAGQAGEEAAVRRLKALGYRILDTNYRCRGGEIDIVARDGDAVVFVEVKARSSDRFGTPYDAVDARKQRRVAAAARAYLVERRLDGVAVRFDVVAVRLDRDPPEVDVLPGAFDAGD